MKSGVVPLAAAVSLLLGACSSVPMRSYPKMALSEPARLALGEYGKKAGKKSFAAAASGGYGYSFGKPDDTDAVRVALQTCQRYAKEICRVIDLDGTSYEDHYGRFAEDSHNALGKLNIVGTAHEQIEVLDWQIAQPRGLRTLEQGVHFATPATLDGISVISTAELVARLKAGNITLIDAFGMAVGETRSTLPSAVTVDFAGFAFGADVSGGLDGEVTKHLGQVMQKIAPDKHQPIAAFCSSPECWLSVNTLLRLKAIGYTNLYWYRGGIQAWSRAGLPTVTSVPNATAAF